VRRACKFCKATVDGSLESVSHFTHSHPLVCPWRDDRVPALNGVHVGDHWMNQHTKSVVRVTEIRLGGHGTYCEHEPTVMLDDVDIVAGYARDRDPQPTLWQDEPLPTHEQLAKLPLLVNAYGRMGEPLWGLVEHWTPLTRPGEYPVPWEMRDRGGRWPLRSALDEWRCPGLRGSEYSERKQAAYWHAFHVSTQTYSSSGWGWWQFDPDNPTRELGVVIPRQLRLPLAA
jgi:hypothetical protein